MQFKHTLVHGTLIKRYKRFLADITLDNGEVVTAHCTNSGSMKSCLEEGAEVFLSPVDNPKRKTRFTWEMIKLNGHWVGINTANPNQLVHEAILNKTIPGLDRYDRAIREVKFDESRLDIFAENSEEQCAIEVKNVSMRDNDRALFPDAKTTRGLKHLHTLIRLKKEGMRAVMVYVIQRTDVSSFAPAKTIDADYAEGLKEAVANGVEVFPLQVNVTPTEIFILKLLPYSV
jgi:sugar fermentation stimulation protein A